MSAPRLMIGKRKKSRQKQPNQMFLKWLQEWRDDAASKGNKSQFTYSKAFSSLKKYPLKLASGKDCKMLEGFGDKICSMLDKKLEAYLSTNGSADVSEDDSQDGIITQGLHPSLPRGLHCISSDSGSEDGDKLTTSCQARRRPQVVRDQRDYVPTFRSGPYALVVTLFKEIQIRGVSHLSKKDLMRLAQPLADKSFTIPDPASRYTAWSAMGSLIKKGLIIKEHSPAKYCLSASGKVLGHRLLAADGARSPGCSPNQPLHFTIGGGGGERVATQRSKVTEADPDLPALCLSPRKVKNEIPGIISPAAKRKRITMAKIELSDSDADDMQVSSLLNRVNKKLANVSPEMPGKVSVPESISQNTQNSPSSRLKFTYVSDSDERVKHKDMAAVLIEDDFGVGFLVKATYEDLLMSGMRYQLDTSRSSAEGHVYAYLHNEDAPEASSSTVHTEERVKLGVTTVKGKSFKTATERHTTKEPHVSKELPTSVNTSSQLSFSSISTRVFPARLDSQASLPTSTENSQTSTTSEAWQDSLPPSDFSLWTGTFEVVLLVDNQEVYGAGSSKNTLITELRKNKVPMEVRNLQVGDFLWIARPKLGPDANSKELVLDYIIERKRMDDLASSIIDGRFREQKFRLKNCGLRNPIYLVEDYGSVQHFSIDKDALSQAVVNTQIIDGFYIKRTGDIKESVAYLTMMTRYLESFYVNKTIHACSKKDKDKQPGKVCFTDKEIRLLTFVEFDRLSVKTRKLTVKETFGKQLVQIQGITVEKAAATVEKYSTVTSLMEAYSQCVSVKEKENLLCSVKYGAVSRSIGQGMSKQIYWLYSREPLV